MSNELNKAFIDPSGNIYQRETLRELPERYRFMDGLETVIEQDWLQYGAFRPHRALPALYVTLQDQEGYVIPHGTVVTAEGIRQAGGAWNQKAGVDESGRFAYANGFSETGAGHADLFGHVDDLYGYDRTLDGVLLPCNGTTIPEIDRYTRHDVEIGRIKPTGGLVSDSDIGQPALTRPGNKKPIGVLAFQVMRETHGANLSYNLMTAALSVVRYGVIKIPYVVANANTIQSSLKGPGGDAGYNATYWRHQFLVVEDPTLVDHDSDVYVDSNGKLVLPSASTGFQRLGKVVSWTNNVFDSLRGAVDTFPGHDVPGTNTGGLDRRLFDFVSRIRSARGLSTSITDIVADVQAGLYGQVKVMFNLTP